VNGHRPVEVELQSLWAEIASLKANLRPLGERVRLLEDQMDTFVLTPWWKRLWFAVDGWPLYRLAGRAQWRPWRCEACKRRKALLRAAVTGKPCEGCPDGD